MNFVDTWKAHDFAQTTARITGRTEADVRRAMRRAQDRIGLDDLEALLSPAAAPFLEEMAQLSHRLTVDRFGRTMQLYAPLYLSNVCSNICTYCGFSAQNRIARRILTDDEIQIEGDSLREMGFEHVLLVTGEAGHVGRNYLANALRLLRPKFASLSMEVQPLDTPDYAALAQTGLSAVLVYQETYDPAAYPRFHLKGSKMDMAYRLETPDRLGRAGIKKIGLGPLFGLSDWRAEAWFAGLHLRHLEKTYWRTRYSLSFPRLRPHEGGELRLAAFGERDLVQALCALRIFSREVELSLSTRESPAFRDRAFRLGFTSMSAGSRTNPGGYAVAPDSLEQFAVGDDRGPAEVASMLRRAGYEPVWKDWDATYDGGEIEPEVGMAASEGAARK
jgi:2-iminoacetate synthase